MIFFERMNPVGKLIQMMKMGIMAVLMLAILLPAQTTNAAAISVNQDFSKKLSADLKKYLKKAGGTVTLQYRDLITGESYQLNGRKSGHAASTIKLPLAIYIMEQAAKGKIDLNQKLTYHKSQYYGGTGVIQYQKVGTKYTIRDLLSKAMIHSDNIAFIMLKDKVGANHFISYMKSLGAQYTYPNGSNVTSPNDLIIYARELYKFSQENRLGQELVGYLKKTDFNTTIPRGIRGVQIAHKVGMIPESLIFNDVGIIYDKTPFALAIMTGHLSNAKSQKVIADVAAMVYKYHKSKASAQYIHTKEKVTVYQSVSSQKKLSILNPGHTFKLVSNNGAWSVIRFGKEAGVIHRTSLIALRTTSTTSFTKTAPKAGTLLFNQDTSVMDRPYSKGLVMGLISKGQQTFFAKLVNDYYLIDLGGRMGYVQKKNVTVVKGS